LYSPRGEHEVRPYRRIFILADGATAPHERLASGLSSGIFTQEPVNNTLLESFATHVRALIDFLYSEKPRNDAVIAEDYFTSAKKWEKLRPIISEALTNSRLRAHKEIVHLSYDRLKVTPESKPWRFLEIRDEINRVMNIFLNNVNKELLGKIWDIKKEN
jgi:hypothetical protein